MCFLTKISVLVTLLSGSILQLLDEVIQIISILTEISVTISMSTYSLVEVYRLATYYIKVLM